MRHSFLLDSNVLVYVLNERAAVVELLHRVTDLETEDKPSVSAMTVYEVLAGTRPDDYERTTDLLLSLDVIPVTATVAARAALLAQWQREQGQRVAVADTLIAGTALTYRKTLVTYDLGHFSRLGVDLYPDLPPLDTDR